MTYRCFADADEQVADEWAAQPQTAEKWKLVGPIGVGESGSFHAAAENGRRGVCKAAFHGGGAPRAAHERIASCLARSLQLPVPPVCLWRDPATSQLYSISAWAFAQALTWGEIATRLSAVFMQNVAATFSAARVFHTWIGDTDHNGNPGNVVVDVGSTDARPGVAFIDHAFSMSYTAGFDTAAPAAVPVSYIPAALMDAAATRQMVKSINGLEANFIEDTVGQVPDPFLPADRRSAIIRGLLKRRVELATAFGVPSV
jgi:hypothetical protein